jgi:hypothetical protein
MMMMMRRRRGRMYPKQKIAMSEVDAGRGGRGGEGEEHFGAGLFVCGLIGR